MFEAMRILNEQGKEVIAMGPRLVLCYWEADKSYVSWYWYRHGDTVVLENGDYIPASLESKEYALKAYYERSAKVIGV